MNVNTRVSYMQGMWPVGILALRCSLSIEWEQGATNSEADCEKEFIKQAPLYTSKSSLRLTSKLRLTASQAGNGVESLALGPMTYTITPTQQRVITKDPG